MNNIQKKFNKIISKLKTQISKRGYTENLGQKEARAFNDWLGELMTNDQISYAEMAEWSGKMFQTVLEL